MKKLLSLLVVSALGSSLAQVYGQNNESPLRIYDGAVYVINSSNGQWAAGATQGVAYIGNSVTGETYKYGSEENATGYSVNTICNDGTVCGTYAERAAIWTPEGEWRELPVKDTDNGTSTCYGGPADGSFLVGNVARTSGFGDNSDGIGAPISEVPVIWYRNADGFYDVYEELPHTDEDWTGRAPQTMFIKGVSADGNTIVGRLIDYSGVVHLPVVWSRDENNEWTYKLYGEEYSFNTDAKKPEHPRYQPLEPDARDYYTAEELERFNEAMAAYEDSVAHANDYSVPDNERWPWPSYNPEEHYADFFDISTQDGAERRNEFAALYNKFLDEYAAYSDSLNTFFTDFYYYINEEVFYMIDVATSESGRYMVTDYVNNNTGIFYPVMFDFETGDVTFIPECAGGYFPLSVLDDGTVFMGQIAVMPPLYRYTSVWTKDKGLYPFGEWIKSVSATAYEDLTAQFELSGDNIMLGSACTTNGLGAYVCGFNQYNDMSYKSWTLDLTSYADSKYSAEEAVADGAGVEVYPNPVTDRIFVRGCDNASLMLFDVTGRCVLQSAVASEGVAVDMLPRGIYILKVSDGEKAFDKKIVVE